MARQYDNLFVTTPMQHSAPSGEEHALYSEYVDELLNIPTLRDEVAAAPRPVLLADFRQGQRPNVRKESRGDPYAVREERAIDFHNVYAEYAAGAAAPTVVAAPAIAAAPAVSAAPAIAAAPAVSAAPAIAPATPVKKKRRAKAKGASTPPAPARKRGGRAKKPRKT